MIGNLLLAALGLFCVGYWTVEGVKLRRWLREVDRLMADTEACLAAGKARRAREASWPPTPVPARESSPNGRREG